ncbi:MAG TPA: zinc dependent phospholipase C family protein [Desulfosporosinus sp.]
MPKELTHWHIAREALQRGLPVKVGEIITSNPALYYIGAVAHDIAYYDLSKPSEARIERVANQLHGMDGENTLVPLSEMMDTALKQDDNQALLAFLLGMLTHFVADSAFHPMVYYMSGNYFAKDPDERSKAVFRHRLLETGIDLWLETVDPIEYPSDLIHLWREAGGDGPRALQLLVGYYAHLGDENIIGHFSKAWRNHRFLQTAFSWSTPWRVLALYRRFGHPSIEQLEALFYPQPLDLSFFDANLDWSHPVTGEPNKMTLAELCELSAKKVVELFELLGTEALENWPRLLRRQPPLSLDSGLCYVPVSQMKYFSTEPIEQRLRVR